MLLSILSFFIGGIYIGKKTNNKGYIAGLKLSLIMIILFLILSLIFNNLKVTRIIYFIITTICITFGSMIGINKTKNNNNLKTDNKSQPINNYNKQSKYKNDNNKKDIKEKK